MNEHIDLLNHGQIWRGTQTKSKLETVSTGFRALDQLLPGAGWPKGSVTELITGSPGIGELRLIVPLLKKLTQEQNKWVLWVAPPYTPYGPALQQYGISPDRIILVNSNDVKEQLWAMEQGLNSGLCSAVLGWPRKISPAHLRRLQLCAANQASHCFIFNSLQAERTNSPIPLKILLSACTQTTGSTIDTSRLKIKILKRRGSWPMQHAQIISLAPYMATSNPVTSDPVSTATNDWPAKYGEKKPDGQLIAVENNDLIQESCNRSCQPLSRES